MTGCKKIPYEVASLIPTAQLIIARRNIKEFHSGIVLLENQLKKCPGIRETNGMKEHPAIFHYFYGTTDIYICEYNKDDYMFGYAILNGEIQFSEWGYFLRTDLINTPHYNIDFHFEEQSIEAALYKQYSQHFKKPQSLTA